MSIEDKAKEAIGVIQKQILELGEITNGVSKDSDYEVGNEKIRRWKSRTVKILSDKVNSTEANNLEKKQTGNAPFDLVLRIRNEANLYIAFLQSLIDELDKHPDDFFFEQPQVEKEAKVKDTSKLTTLKTVFVVHGRNDKLRESMFIFLRAVGLKPVEWSQAIQATKKPSPYIGEILDTAFTKAQAIVVLFSGDDEARLTENFWQVTDQQYEKELTPQPRTNVIFEAGMAIGRDENRTILVQVGKVRPISDIAGRHITHLDNTSQKRQELVKKLESAGCEVDITGTDWHSVGDFQEKYIKDNTQKGRIRWI